MSESTVEGGVASAARAAMVEVRRAEHHVLEQVTALDEVGAVATFGYRALRRLLEDLWRLDPAPARRLVTRAALLARRATLSGETLDPVLPATAAASAAGLLDDGHLRVIAATTEHLARLPHLAPEQFADAEATLAHHATQLAPAGLERVARRLIDTLDPDGAAPPEPDEPADELYLVHHHDGTLEMAARVHGRADAELVTEVFDRLSAPAGPDDPRTLAQRRAEVLLDLCAQAASPTGIAAPVDAPTGSTGDAEAADRTDADTGTDTGTGTDRPRIDDTTDGDDPGADAERERHAAHDHASAHAGHDHASAHAGHDHASAHAGHDHACSRDGHGDRAGHDGPADHDHPSARDRHGDRADYYGLDHDEPDHDEPDDQGGPADRARPTGSARRARPIRRPGCPTVPVLGRALLSLTIDQQWLRDQVGHGLLDSGHALDPATARRLACDAGIVPTVLGSRSEPLDVGRLSYTVPDGMRRALHHRDGGCSFPGCTRRPARCHAHHVIHWLDGGRTEIDNLCLVCRYHHHLIHHGGWTVTMIDGRPWYIPPAFIDPDRTPRPGGPRTAVAG